MFKKGTKVICVFYSSFQGPYYEASEGVITKVKDGVAYFEDDWGITYNSKTGEELENFFPGMRKFLVKKSELNKHPDAKAIKQALADRE